jgi:hypothetical protein
MYLPCTHTRSLKLIAAAASASLVLMLGAAAAVHAQGVDLLTQGKQHRVQIQAADAAFAKSHEELLRVLSNTIAQIPPSAIPDEFRYERASLEVLRQYVQELRKQGDVVLASLGRYVQNGRQYEAVRTSVVPTFQQVAQQFHAYAKDEPYADRREDYARIAGIFELLAERYTKPPRVYSPDLRSVEELYPYVASTQQLLERFEAVLEIVPAEGESDQSTLSTEELARFVQSYSGFRKALGQLHERLGGATSSPPRSTPPSTLASPAQPRSSSPSMQSESYPLTSNSLHRAAPSNHQQGTRSVDSGSSRYVSTDGDDAYVHRNILAFHLNGNDMIRREISGVDVREGTMHRVPTWQGQSTVVRVVRPMHGTLARDTTVWLAEVVQDGARTVPMRLVANH